MSNALAESAAVILLFATLAAAVVRPRGLPEAVVAVPAAGALLALRILPLSQARDEVRSLAPTLAFLGAVLLLAAMADRFELFEAAGGWTASASAGSLSRCSPSCS
jgi:arsenical pump membrane protein